MKKIFQSLMVSAFFVGVGLPASSVSAESSSCSDAEITNTGPESENKIICQDENTVVIQCTNGTIVNVDINQDSNSGDADNSGNTNGGNASTGDANNNSNAEVDVDNACGSSTETVKVAQEEPTPVTPKEADAPVVTETVQASDPVQVLPETNGSSNVFIASVIAGSLALAAGLTQLASTLYQKFQN